jgi:hypothetical protein
MIASANRSGGVRAPEFSRDLEGGQFCPQPPFQAALTAAEALPCGYPCAILDLRRSRAVPVRRTIQAADLGPALSRRPSSEFPLSAAEAKLLKDPDWIDEEEADLILAIREERQHDLRGENIRDFARRHGRDLKG